MNRDDMLAQVQDEASWDFIIVGGGATGLGVAIDAATRGNRTLLLEMSDFAKATSSRSTKLVHGGVRYLQQGNIALVLEALKERGLLRQNAPHLVKDLPFIVPNYDWWEGPYYGIGLKLYDMLAGKYGFGRSKNLSREETLARIPTVTPEGLIGGVIYHDGQFDDARLAVNMAQTAAEQGAVLVNYMKVTALTKQDGEVKGVVAQDLEGDKEYEIEARVVINAAGIFSDEVRRMDDPDVPGRMKPSQGIHIVLDRSFLPGDTAIMVPKTDDGRVLFAVPWHDVIIVGTTETPVDGPSLEPVPLEEEVDFLLEHTQRYLRHDPTREDLLSVFAGIRPLVSQSETGDTSKISREHQVSISPTGLLTIAGGKWTTYRNMAEDTVDQAVLLSGLDEKECVTRSLQLRGYHQNADDFGDLALYGSDAPALRELMRNGYDEVLHDDHPVTTAQVVWAVRKEMARTVDDFLARRTRMLLLDARASIAMAPRVAERMAEELGRDEAWQQEQVQTYRDIAAGYLA